MHKKLVFSLWFVLLDEPGTAENRVMGRQLESMTVETDTEELGISYSYDMSGMRSGKTVVTGTNDSGNEGGGDEGGIVVPGCDHEWVEINRTEYHIFYQCIKCSSTYQEPIQAPPTEYSLRSGSPTEYHEYIYASGRLMREIITTTANGTSTTEVLDFVYGSGSAPLALVYTNGTASPVTYYYITNMQGDVVKMVNASGTTVASYAYDAWGKVLSATGDMAEVNPIRYRGYYYDSETGLYYLQSRYYDPAVKRFVNADALASTGQGFTGYNMFAYCGNCPVNCYDPFGTMQTYMNMDEDETVQYEEFCWIYHQATHNKYVAPLIDNGYSFVVCTVDVEYNVSYKNTAGFFARNSDFFTWLGAASTVLGLFNNAKARLLGTLGGIASSAAGVAGIYQSDNIDTALGGAPGTGMTKFTITWSYYGQKTVSTGTDSTTGLMCMCSFTEVYYYEPYTGRLYDGNAKKYIGGVGHDTLP